MRAISRVAAAGCILGVALAALAQETPRTYQIGDEGLTPPRLVRQVKPKYTKEAREAGIQGTVMLEAVVLEDGRVEDVRVTRSLDQVYGLDDQAAKALKQWLFAPGEKDGKAVRVQVEVEMTFTLK